MARIDLRTWKVMDSDAEVQAPAPVITAEAEAPQSDAVEMNSPVVESYPTPIPQSEGAVLPVVLSDEPEHDTEEDVPELSLVLTFPVMVVNAQAVRNGEGKNATDVYEFDLKMRLSSADAAQVFSKLMGHVCLASFKSPNSDGDL